MRNFQGILFRSFRSALKNPKRTLLLWSLGLAISLFGVSQIRTELRIYDIQDKAFPSTSDLANTKRIFEDGNSAIFIFANKVHADESLNQKQLCAIRAWAKAEAALNPAIENNTSPFRFRMPNWDGTRLNYPLVISDQCTHDEEASLAPAHLQKMLGTPWEGMFTNHTLSDLAIEFLYKTPSDQEHFNPVVIDESLTRARTELETPEIGLKVYLTGRAAPEYQFWKVMQKDRRINLLLCAAILILLRWLLGTWLSGCLFILSLAITCTFVVGGMGLVGTPLDVLNSNIFMILCVAGLEDFLFISYLIKKNPKHWRTSFRKILVPGFFTSLSTFIGFLSLLVTDLLIVRRFGFWAGIGAFIEWGVSFYFLPAFCTFFSKTQWVKAKVILLAPRLRIIPKWCLKISFLFFFMGVLGFGFLNTEDSLDENFPRGNLHRETFLYTQATRGWEGTVQVVFEPDANIEKILKSLRQSPIVSRIDDKANMLRFYSSGLPLPIANMVSQELETGNILSKFKSVPGSGNKERAIIYLKDFKLSSLNTVTQLVETACPSQECKTVGEGIVFSEFSKRIIVVLLESFLTSLILVGLVLIILSRNLPWKTRLSILYSAFWGPVTMIGLMAIFQIPISQMTSFFAAVLVGLAGDNAIQYIFARKGKNGDLKSGAESRSEVSHAVTLVLAVSALCFLGLTLKPMKLLGVLFFGGFLLTLVGDFYLLKALLPQKLKT